MSIKSYLNEGSPDSGEIVTKEQAPVSASPLENPGSTEVTPGTGPSIGVANLQQQIEAHYTEKDWHQETHFTQVDSAVPASSMDPQMHAENAAGGRAPNLGR